MCNICIIAIILLVILIEISTGNVTGTRRANNMKSRNMKSINTYRHQNMRASNISLNPDSTDTYPDVNQLTNDRF